MRGYVTSRGHTGVTFGIGGLVAVAILGLMLAVFVGVALVVLLAAMVVLFLVKLGIAPYRQHQAKKAGSIPARKAGP